MGLSENDIYANRIFLNAVLPNLKTVAQDLPEIAKLWQGRNALCQISARDGDGKVGTHFIIEKGAWKVVPGISENKPDIELEFPSIPRLNSFFQGKSKALPKIHGLLNPGLLIPFMKTLLKMASLLNMTKPPEDERLKGLLVKMYFFLLPAGISQLNKAGYREIKDWTKNMPDRVFSFEVEGHPEVASYLRIKAGMTKVGRGLYTLSTPFFAMRFQSFDAALGILMGTDDMMASQTGGKMIIDGAPELGMVLGGFLFTVGDFAKGLR